MKKTIAALLCSALLACGGVNAFAYAPLPPENEILSTSPRYSNIALTSEEVTANGNSIKCISLCKSNFESRINITITQKDYITGREISSKRNTVNGFTNKFTANFNVSRGKDYTIVFTYNVDGEVVTYSQDYFA